ncbi:hypothetical protein WJU16_11600 [Chitinophaga pollutisoli]|uniref:Uncharacterized protein n=1 Tax=Chitinophaga pollutisoli TaxID=3133966 RepID=A0ABZ2YWU0_9BACT
MNLDTYPVESSDDLLTHLFMSDGPNGKILKRIEFQHTKPGCYNLAFGDWKEEDQRLDDTIRSNNKDLEKVLSTVAMVVDLFLTASPSARIEMTGSTASRTRLYQMKILQNLQKINEHYIIKGHNGNAWEVINTAMIYSAFFIEHKKYA